MQPMLCSSFFLHPLSSEPLGVQAEAGKLRGCVSSPSLLFAWNLHQFESATSCSGLGEGDLSLPELLGTA